MPSRSLADLTQKDWIRACERLGLLVQTNHGKGSHVLVVSVDGQRKYTVQFKLNKIINQKIFRLLQTWGFSEDQIWDKL